MLLVIGDATYQGNSDELVLLPRWEGAPWEQHGWKHPEPIAFGRGLTLERLDRELGEAVMNACSPRGHYFVPVRQFGPMYTFVLAVDAAELAQRHWTWDTGGVIQEAVAMSRLVLDNGYSTDYAARVFDYTSGEQQIMPASVRRPTYRLRRTRDWLTHAEADELTELVSSYWEVRDALPERVTHALWQAEYAATVRWLDVIGPLLVIAYEALINTSKQLVTRQFQERVPAVTAEAGAPLSKSLCTWMYDARSRWVHGSRIPLEQLSRVVDDGH